MSDRLQSGALLAHPDNGGVRLVAGPADANWAGVVVETDEAALPEDDAGRLAVLTGVPPARPWQQDALVRRIRDRGFRALAMQQADGFGAGTRALADRLGFTLLHVDRPMLLAKACWQLVEARDSLTLGYVRKVAQSIEYHAEGLPDLLRHLSSSVGHGIALIDSEGVLLEAGGRLTPEVHAAIDFSPWTDLTRAGSGTAASVRVDSPSREGLRLAFFGDGLDERQVSALAVAAEVAMPAVAARILIDEVAEVSDASVSSGVLRDFVDLRGRPDPEVERRMLERGWRTTGYHLAFRTVGRSRVDALQLLRFVTSALGRIAADSHATTSGRGVSGWLTFTEPPPPSQVERYVGALRELHVEARRSFNVATAVGSLASGSAGLTSSLSEAADAVRIAVNRSTTGWFVRVDGLGLEQLLLAWTGNDIFVPAARSLLAPLQAGQGELLTTLSAYLDHESAVGPTAAALGLHRNTVATRITRAQELLGVDMADPEVRLALHLACRAVR
ncbi:helix-turn-helix domain-containing protein [Plantibacter sp. VKM Ac-2880]|uniref:PucR family transcriptional regulator n=1 Tax=Plantibacter sp. VKM Ac-2880 TaxID=2783827 RepID=UPI001890A50E|nr:helix-turn-helix domain-containing protein [Plantibacter sp. VKM Ac-2880]MBF4567507.1 helix-turn-helix domain-containing protein [Plantibacter sp. VKM Ac-2880]